MSSGNDWALAFPWEPHSIQGRQTRGPKCMLSLVPLHRNTLSCKSCPLDLSRNRYQQRSDFLFFRTAQIQDVALPAMEVADLPQASLQSGGKTKVPQIVNVHFLSSFAPLLSTSSPCIFELPCYRTTRHFMRMCCAAGCSPREPHVSQGAWGCQARFLLKGARPWGGEGSFRRFPHSH